MGEGCKSSAATGLGRRPVTRRGPCSQNASRLRYFEKRKGGGETTRTQLSASSKGMSSNVSVQTISDQDEMQEVQNELPQSPFLTGSMDITTAGATSSFCVKPLMTEKTIVVVRHGMSTWNKEKRIQGSTDLSELTSFGRDQARRCQSAIRRIPFDSCFASPLKRAATTAEIIWEDRKEPLIFLDELKEADLGHLQGMKNGAVPSDCIAWKRVRCC